MNSIKRIAFSAVLIGLFGVVQAQAASDECIDTGLKATQESMHKAENYTAESGNQSDRKLSSGERDYIWTINHTNW
ncbi:hypothetical protein [Marinobacterium mangrovicola]|uniref:Uncharacterized protein n=1 Tax=Marinobacterium mangrovicola TaxID=1476959 RepID=A0A4R1GNC8_9GAMM|nr:hypothetical protein [Marinobacterium mangrovicola]TCK08743.1 hypothetical protein CLV83_0835 [Marinobacterium mangrovicola]